MKIEELNKITPWPELEVIMQSRELRAIFADMAKRIEHIPAIGETDGNDDAQAVFHYFDTFGSADWYVFEVDLQTGEGFGFVTLSGDITDPYAEYGYINLFDLAKNARLNLDLHYHEGITKKQIWNKRYGDGDTVVSEETAERREYERIGTV